MVVVARCSCTLCNWIRQCTAWTASTSHGLADWLKSLPCYVGEPGVHVIDYFFFRCLQPRVVSQLRERARLIPMTRGITSVAADDSALTSLVACSMGVNSLKFYCTQNDWTLNPASSIGTQTPSAARPAAVLRLWSKAFIGGLVAYPTEIA